MEYQAKELFAKHGVTTTLGVVVETADAAQAAAAGAAGVSCAARVAATAGAVASGAPVTASITGRGTTPLAHCLCSSRLSMSSGRNGASSGSSSRLRRPSRSRK